MWRPWPQAADLVGTRAFARQAQGAPGRVGLRWAKEEEGAVHEVTRDDIEQLPKIELHVHLEGSVRADTAAGLARRHGEDPAEVLVIDDGGYPRHYAGFEHFLDTFLKTSRQIRTPDDLATIASDFARHQARQRVLYSEVTFTAVTLLRGGIESEAMWRALADGFADVADTEVNLVVDAVRDLGVEHAHDTIRAVEEGLGTAPIVAFGLSGIEGSEPEGSFRLLRQAADRLGLGLVAHAGETGTADNVRAAVDDLGADRIGHGIAVADDPELLARLARSAVTFEVCPSSNVKLGLVESLEAHPFPQLWDAGLRVTVNSDDPPFFSTTLTDELEHAARLADLDRHDLARLQRRAAESAFATRATRERLQGAVDAWEHQ